MAESEEQQIAAVEESPDDVNEAGSKYIAPAEKSIKEILNTDNDDESLRKYKEQLLGKETEFWPGDDRNILLRKMFLVVEGRSDKELNLDDKMQLKNMKFIVKEGAMYRLKVTFNIQREIVSGLRFFNKVNKGLIGVAKTNYMVGSFGPQKDEYTFTSPEEEFPSGMIGRGEYKVKSVFTDDDDKKILSWKWNFEIKKDWKD